MYEEGSIGNLEWDTEQEFDNLKESILHQKEELIDLLEENKNELFGYEGDWSFDWEDEVSSESGYASGYLEVDFNIATINVKLDTWIAYINKVLELAYEFWMGERPRDAFNEGDEISDIKVSKLEPDIWKSRKKSR